MYVEGDVVGGVVLTQRTLVFCQPLTALRLPHDFSQMLFQRLRKIDIELFRLLQEIGVNAEIGRFFWGGRVENKVAHSFSLTLAMRIIYAHRLRTSMRLPLTNSLALSQVGEASEFAYIVRSYLWIAAWHGTNQNSRCAHA